MIYPLQNFVFLAKALIKDRGSFFRTEAAGGLALILAAVVALIVANTPLYGLHQNIMAAEPVFGLPVLSWINDGLMAVFFFLVGLEIKREMMVGALSGRDRAVLPMLAAVAGMAVPALVYLAVNINVPDNFSGWAIPAATDIAFALCIISLAGNRVPVALKVLLMAIAVIDDLGAIMIIAVFYNHGLHAGPLVVAAVVVVALWVLNRRNVCAITPYAILGLVLWVAILQSGIHATLAGVLTALFVPVRSLRDSHHSPLDHAVHGLHPWVAFAVLPLFGFANAGVSFAGMGWSSFGDPVALGIILGLVIGKPLGIFTALFLAIRLRLSPMPAGVTFVHLFGMAALCGIGFTMSLFIGALAFGDAVRQVDLRLGVLAGSIVSAAIGYAVLRHGSSARKTTG